MLLAALLALVFAMTLSGSSGIGPRQQSVAGAEPAANVVTVLQAEDKPGGDAPH